MYSSSVSQKQLKTLYFKPALSTAYTVPRKRDGFFFSTMKTPIEFIYFFVTAALLGLCGCATPEDPYHDEKEYSDMPWNTPQQWEGSRSIPGAGGGGGGY